jgi:hypothetical protein
MLFRVMPVNPIFAGEAKAFWVRLRLVPVGFVPHLFHILVKTQNIKYRQSYGLPLLWSLRSSALLLLDHI